MANSLPKVILTHGECLAEMAEIPDNYVDMVMCDLPYGTTQNKWDSIIDLTQLWKQYKRICKPTAAIVLTAAQPFTSVLVCSNLRDFKYEWVWRKQQGTGFLNAKKQPLRNHEQVLVFYRVPPTYNPQMTEGTAYKRSKARAEVASTDYGKHVDIDREKGPERYPLTVVDFNTERGLHPTQKPVVLMEYLIKTYTNPGDTVLDNCMGSGTTGVACVNTSRSFIGIEQDAAYFKIASERIAAVHRKPSDEAGESSI
jgi:site-specific DNA-methyltransferase (adenine-specific)